VAAGAAVPLKGPEMKLRTTKGERENAPYWTALAQGTLAPLLLSDVETLRAALEACQAQLLADTKSLAMETAMTVKVSACYWKEFMSPAWIDANELLSD
jgi:hypothetical protein